MLFKRGIWAAVLFLGVVFFFAPSRAEANSEDNGWWGMILRNFFDWMTGRLDNITGRIVDLLFAAVPADWQGTITGLAEMLTTANAWLPLGYGVGLLSMYFSFLAVFVTVKLILKLIPMIG